MTDQSFDDEVWNRPTIGGDAGGIAINASLALLAIREALAKLAAGGNVDIKDSLDEIDQMAVALNEQFQDLTGWADRHDA